MYVPILSQNGTSTEFRIMKTHQNRFRIFTKYMGLPSTQTLIQQALHRHSPQGILMSILS